VETIRLKTIYVLFFVELGTRQVHLAGLTRNPDSAWVTQQARNLSIEGRLDKVEFLIRDRDSKYSGPFDEVFRTEGVQVIKTRSARRTPMRLPSGGWPPSAQSASEATPRHPRRLDPRVPRLGGVSIRVFVPYGGVQLEESAEYWRSALAAG
jgi:hypothetical protein